MPLIVKPISANITSDKDFFGKADPYCIIMIGNEKQRTRACSGGGKSPQWTDTFQFNSTDAMLRVQVWDDDTFKDDMIGQGTVNLNQCYQNPNRTENEYVDLIHNGRSAGRLLLSIEYQGAPMGGGGQWGGQQGGQWGGQQGGWGGQQGGQWGGQQGGQWGGQQGGWGGQGGQQGGWGGNQGGWGGNQGGGQWGGQGGQQGGWGGQGGQQGGWGGNQQGGWGGQGGRGGW